MFAKLYLLQASKIIVALICFGLGLYSFGHPQLFDALSIILLIITAMFCRHNIDITSLIAVLVFCRLTEDIIFYTSSNHHFFIISAYTLAACCIYAFDRDKLRYVAALALAIAIIAQFYWYLTGYAAPQIYWQIYIISCSLITRFLLVFRPAITEYLSKKTAEHTQLDYKLQKLFGLPIIIELFNITEYTIRHTTTYQPMIIYSIYPYIMQTFLTFALFLVIDHARENRLKNTLNA